EEDGIRAFHVTGVQTCALPIFANQTARLARSPSEFSARFGERIQALARTHDLLTAHSWQGADILSILRERILLPEADDGRVVFAGPEVVLDAQQALHLAMVLHELSSNARKFGALSVPKGRLSVRWSVHDDGERKVRIRWAEQGGPEVTEPQSRGFGTTLISRSLAAHDGKAVVHYEPSGVVCEI